MLKVYEESCDQCLFSKNRIVSAERVREILSDCRKDETHFICHKASIAGANVCCRSFFDTQDTQIIQVVKRIGLFEFVPLPK